MDAVTARWFDDDSVVVRRAPELEGFMTDVQIARLAGAPRDSTVHLRMDVNGMVFRVENNVFSEPMYRYLFQNSDDNYSFYLRNAVFVLAEKYTNEGIGTRCVAREIHEAARWIDKQILITHIKVSAVGNLTTFGLKKYPLRGYYVWATMGFDADIPIATRQRLDPPFKACNSICELVSSEAGREQWKTLGDSVELSFDLAEGSASWLQLARYMHYKGIAL